MKKIIAAKLFLLVCVVYSITSHAQSVDSGQLSKNTKGVAIATPNIDFKLSGGIYLFDYLPLVAGTNNDLSIYAFVLKLDAETKDKRFGLHVESRVRDTKLRPFFNSNIWFQESYGYMHTSWGDLHVGKFYKKVGFLWDGSFFGNVQYFNGLKLNPEFGGEFVGKKAAGDHVDIDYSVQYISNNDHVDGALAGRDVESDTNAAFRNGITARIAPTFKLARRVNLTVGVSGLTGQIDRVVGKSFQMSQVAGELNLEVGKVGFLGEVLVLNGEANDAAHPLSRAGYDNAVYFFGSIRYQVFKKLLARVSYSQVNYQGANSVERELLPGLVYTVRKNVAVIVEYNYWDVTPTGAQSKLLDKSLSFVLHYAF